MFSMPKKELYLHDAVTSVPNSLSRVSGNIVYLSLTNPLKPDCHNIQIIQLLLFHVKEQHGNFQFLCVKIRE